MTRRLPIVLLFALLGSGAFGFRLHKGREAKGDHVKKAHTGGTRMKKVLATAGQPLLKKRKKCSLQDISMPDLEESIELGTKFLERSQKANGIFHYEYNWEDQTYSKADSSVRQAGTMWALAMLHEDAKDNRVLPTVRKGLEFFAKSSTKLPDGRRLLKYPGQSLQQLGTVALVALSHIELLRQPDRLDEAEREELEAHLDGYLRTIHHCEKDDHTFHQSYNAEDGTCNGTSIPHFDGESLLALTKAARYLGREDLWGSVGAIAGAGWRSHAEVGLLKMERAVAWNETEKWAKEMLGYYQWSSMAWYELLDTGKASYEKFGPRLLRYSDWKVETNARNAVAFEGFIPAYVTAVRLGDTARAEKLACVLTEGVRNMHGLQVGHRLAQGLASEAPASDVRAAGGVQNGPDEPRLRIDTTQHQLHAMLMAKRLLMGRELL